MALAVGGAVESLYVEPGTMDIIVQRRQVRQRVATCQRVTLADGYSG